MKIEKITSQHRRDFKADMICEGCGARAKLTRGYDDRYFHDEVIPNMKCEVCGNRVVTWGLYQNRRRQSIRKGIRYETGSERWWMLVLWKR